MSNKKYWPFGKKDANIKLAIPEMQPDRSFSIYRSINKLPLNRFIDCMIDGNLYALVISGDPSKLELQEAWNDILSEYTESISNNEYRLYISLYKEITILQLTYEQVHILAEVLNTVYSKKLCDELNSLLRTSCKFNPLDVSSYRDELLKCVRRSAGIKLKLDLKLLQFDAIKKKHEQKAGDKMEDGREYFTSVMITLSDHAKYQLPDTITVLEYCERIKRLNKHLETLKNVKR